MIQSYTLHTHTVGFDGKDTIWAMINRAREVGFTTIGISDHFVVHPKIKDAKMYQYALRYGYNKMYSASFPEVLSRFVPHYHELNLAQEQNPDIKILRGMEVDFFDDPVWRAGFESALATLKPDYIIGSTHFVESNGQILNTHDWQNEKEKKIQNSLIAKYWDNVANATASGLFTWMAHLDLPKKVGLGREGEWAEYESRAIEAIARANIAIEINTSFYKDGVKDRNEPYPSNRILQMAAQNNIPVLISDDAHNIKDIGRHFEKAQKVIKNLNLKQFDLMQITK